MAAWMITGSFSKGYVATYHDFYKDRVREGLDEYIDADMTKENVALVMPKYLPEDVATGKVKSKKPLKSYIDDYVNERMAPAIKRYNEKQKKRCRRILDQFGDDMKYTDYIKTDINLNEQKQELILEWAIQFGSHDDLGKLFHQAVVNKDQAEIDRIKDIYTTAYKQYLEDFQDNYPHLEVVGAVIHFDEHKNGTPHMHLQVMPVADFSDVKYGIKLDEAICFSKALENDGCGKRTERNKDTFYNRELEVIKTGYVLETDPEYTGTEDDWSVAKKIAPDIEFVLKETKHGERHEHTKQYRERQTKNRKLAKETKALEDAHKKAEEELKALEDQKAATTNSLTARRKMLADAEEQLEELEGRKDEFIGRVEQEMRNAAVDTTEELDELGAFEQQALKDPRVQAVLKEVADEKKRESMDREDTVPKTVLATYLEPPTPVKPSVEDMPS